MLGNGAKIFRKAATERLSSPEQLDQLVAITRPFDWVAASAMALGLVVLIAWSVLGKIPTRVEGEGIERALVLIEAGVLDRGHSLEGLTCGERYYCPSGRVPF